MSIDKLAAIRRTPLFDELDEDALAALAAPAALPSIDKQATHTL